MTRPAATDLDRGSWNAARVLERAEARAHRFRHIGGFVTSLTPAEAQTLRQSRDVRWIEPVRERRAFGIERNLEGQTIPYGINTVHAPGAWGAARSGEIINVAVIDTGIDASHPDLAGLVAGGFSAFGGTHADLNGHGTHVAGTIAALDDASGVVGVAPGIRLWSVRVLNSAGTGSTEGIIEGIEWVIDRMRASGGRWVMNLSLGDDEPSDAEHDAIRIAASEGILVVAASGNSSEPGAPAPVAYPAGYPEVIAVGASDFSGAIADFSNQGPELDLVAPGLSVLSAAPVGTGISTYLIHDVALYDARSIEGSANGVVTGEYVFCGLGKPEEIPSAVEGKIALIQRGEIRFAEKARNARERGAIAVVVFNHEDSTRSHWTLRPKDDPSTQDYPFPVTLSLSREDGECLRDYGPGTVTLTHAADDYTYKSGTSMSAPHVAGAAALLWSIAPDASPEAIREALVGTATDLGAEGFDPVFGAGMLNVYAAAQRLALEAFPRSGRAFVRRGRG
jgi:subtilisin family serine protease